MIIVVKLNSDSTYRLKRSKHVAKKEAKLLLLKVANLTRLGLFYKDMVYEKTFQLSSHIMSCPGHKTLVLVNFLKIVNYTRVRKKN